MSNNEFIVGEAKHQKVDAHGALPSFFGVGADAFEKTMSVTMSAARTLRDEAVGLSSSVLDWTEATQRTGIQIARELLARLDDGSRATLDSLDGVSRSMTSAIRGSSASASEVVAKAAASLTRSEATPRAA